MLDESMVAFFECLMLLFDSISDAEDFCWWKCQIINYMQR